MMVIVQIQESETRVIAVRMLPARERSRGNLVAMVEYAIPLATVFLAHHQESLLSLLYRMLMTRSAIGGHLTLRQIRQRT
uniref:Uncharacterized protein n=1 Tax=Candidatus Methanogaster sp. ANME-2c ERB4 TaxID=2759911 RepID=A0A7G9Y112_9EURY|nr:hypothetical protein KBHNNLIF_00007 [Methanosarcinales archaeon ANME-2c ERB4]